MALRSKWTLRIDGIQTRLRIGSESSEPRSVQVNLKVSGLLDTKPLLPEQCFDHEVMRRWITEIWPHSDATRLLESRVNELAGWVFSTDRRILEVSIALSLDDGPAGTGRIGIEREIPRRQFEMLAIPPRSARRDRRLETATA
ncbi:MAG: hypothetical protein FGM55_02820 [Rhodoferax sp.]|nr:hypothetical protein [Rhodoferax sp.]